jgi:hypothetical protein
MEKMQTSAKKSNQNNPFNIKMLLPFSAAGVKD